MSTPLHGPALSLHVAISRLRVRGYMGEADRLAIADLVAAAVQEVEAADVSFQKLFGDYKRDEEGRGANDS